MIDQLLLDSLWLLIASALVFLMQIGFCALEAGLVRAKNSINVAAKNMTDLCIAGIAFWAVGAAIMFGDGRLADSATENGALRNWGYSFLIFQILFCGTATTIVSGAVAERVRYAAYAVLVLVVTVAIYPVIGAWAWRGIDGGTPGWLEARGFVDFAGSTVVHSVGGWVALSALLLIGPRRGRFEGGSARPQPSNVPLSTIGVGFMWVGWMGFNGGSTLALDNQLGPIILNTILAGCAGGCMAQVVSRLRSGSVSVLAMLNGVLAGLVAVTASCHVVETGAALAIGAVGGVLAMLTQDLLDRLRIDDAVGAVPVHLAAGIWGTLAVALFGRPEDLPLPMIEQLGIQALGIVAIGAYSFVASYALLLVINRVLPLRGSPKAERLGFNVVEHRASTAVTDLIGDMERQRQTGDLSLPVRVEPGSEVESVAAQYNRVVSKIRQDARRLERAHDEIVKSKVEAETANRAKSAFLANMSHELRTPLNAIVGFSELMHRETFGPLSADGRYREYAETIHEAGRHLLAVVNDLLEHSRIEAGKTELQENPVDLGQLLQSIVRMTKDTADRAGVRITVEVAPDMPRLVGDQRLLKQIVLNLASNAIKFTDSGGEVLLQARLEADRRIAMVVSDTGIGMTRDGIQEALEPFRQLQESHARQYPGTGLGLPLVKAMLRLHQATMTIDSVVGEGTAITARFPDSRTWDVSQAELFPQEGQQDAAPA